MAEQDDLKQRLLSIKKTFDVHVSLAWEAWTQPEHIALWWGPKGIQINVIEHDFRVGGKWKYVMPMPGGGEFISEGVYSEIVKFKKIVTSAAFKPMTEGVELRILFEQKGNKTDFTFSVVHPTEAYKLMQEKMGFYNGWGSTLKRLEEHVLQLMANRVS